MPRMADERTTASRARLHALGAMLLAPLTIALLWLTFGLLVLCMPSYPYTVLYTILYIAVFILYLSYILAAIALAVLFIAGAIQLVTGKRLGLVESLYERRSKE